MALDEKRRAARLQVVSDHIRHESAHDLDPFMDTFGSDPEWHNQAGEEVLRGHEPIRGFYHDLFSGFPDFHIDVTRTHSAEDAVIVEGHLGGTHKAAWMGIPATGKSVSAPFSAVFTFNDEDRVKSEIVYYDRMMLLGQLGVLSRVG